MQNDPRVQLNQDATKVWVHILDALPQDGGSYECIARNLKGETRCRCSLKISCRFNHSFELLKI